MFQSYQEQLIAYTLIQLIQKLNINGLMVELNENKHVFLYEDDELNCYSYEDLKDDVGEFVHLEFLYNTGK